MAIKVTKTFGERPETVVVLTEKVQFDSEGVAEVSEEVASVLRNIQGYEVEEPKAPKKPAKEAEPTEETSEEEEVKAPKKQAPKKLAPKKA